MDFGSRPTGAACDHCGNELKDREPIMAFGDTQTQQIEYLHADPVFYPRTWECQQGRMAKVSRSPAGRYEWASFKAVA